MSLDKHRILYELVDESDVEVLHITNPLAQPGIDSYRYPKAGNLHRCNLFHVYFNENDKPATMVIHNVCYGIYIMNSFVIMYTYYLK